MSLRMPTEVAGDFLVCVACRLSLNKSLGQQYAGAGSGRAIGSTAGREQWRQAVLCLAHVIKEVKVFFRDVEMSDVYFTISPNSNCTVLNKQVHVKF